MFILASELGTKIWAVFRYILWWIDSIGFAFIDNTYDLMVTIMAGFNSDAIADITKDIIQNSYILVGIFAFFRIAVMLVESIVNPDKLSDKNVGLSKVFVNFVIAIVMLIVVPMIFSFSRDIQHKLVVENQVIPNLILGTDLNTGKAGETMQLIAIKGLIRPDEKIADRKTSSNSSDQENFKGESYSPNDNCSSGSTCSNAVAAWNDNKVKTKTVSKFIDEYVKVGEEYVFVYEYIPFIPLAAGLFITYVLLSFTIDIGIRSVELVVLEIVSPFFIVTFIDPKMASSGPFKKWLNACIKSYLSLFIRIAIISVIFLFLSNFQDLVGSFNKDNNALANIILLLCILIFAKKAPKWIGEMFGLSDGAGVGGLGIGKKLAGAAAVGGLIGSGIEKARGVAKQKGKNFAGNRARNTLARIGAMGETAKQNHLKRKNAVGGQYEKESIWKKGRAAAKQSKADNYGKDIGNLKDITAGYMAGRANVNPQSKSIKEKMNDKYQLKNAEFQASIGNTEEKRAKALDYANKNKVAAKLYDGKLGMDPSGSGDRIQIEGTNGKKVYLNPQGAKEMNEAFNYPRTAEDAFEAFGTNLAISQGIPASDIKVDSDGKKYFMKNGEKINLSEFGAKNMTRAGRLAVANLVAENVEKDVANYSMSRENLTAARQNYSTTVIQYNQASERYSNDPRIVDAQQTLSKFDEAQKIINTKTTAQNTITKISQSEDYIKLKNADKQNLPIQDQKRLEEYERNIDVQKELINNISDKYMDATNYVASHKVESQKALSIISNVKEEYGIKKMEEQMSESKKLIDSWEKEVEKYEEKFKNTKCYEITDEGTFKKDKNGNFVEKNPYEVEVPGETNPLNVAKDYIRINEIRNVLNMKSSKTKKDYDDVVNSKKE